MRSAQGLYYCEGTCCSMTGLTNTNSGVDNNIGSYVKYSAQERGKMCGGWLIGFINNYALIRDSSDLVTAIEIWRLEDV